MRRYKPGERVRKGGMLGLVLQFEPWSMSMPHNVLVRWMGPRRGIPTCWVSYHGMERAPRQRVDAGPRHL